MLTESLQEALKANFPGERLEIKTMKTLNVM